jgi:hypothetical protein
MRYLFPFESRLFSKGYALLTAGKKKYRLPPEKSRSEICTLRLVINGANLYKISIDPHIYHLQLHTFEFGTEVMITSYSHQFQGSSLKPFSDDQKG